MHWRNISLIALLLCCPVASVAQQAGAPTIGFLSSRSPDDSEAVRTAFLTGLSDQGYIVGRSVGIEYRWASGNYQLLPKLAAELVDKKVRAIFAAGGDPSALAAKSATSTVPIVFTTGSDPVKTGLVASLGRPGGNLTGITFLVAELAAKRLELLRELLPKSQSIGFLINPQNSSSQIEAIDLRIAAAKTGRDVDVIYAKDRASLEKAFIELKSGKEDALLIGNDPFFNGQREYLVELAAKHSIPTFYYAQEFVSAGGLISYGASIPEAYREAGHHIARILKGAKPADLPIMQPTKFEIAINMKTAKSLALDVPIFLQQRADAVIE